MKRNLLVILFVLSLLCGACGSAAPALRTSTGAEPAETQTAAETLPAETEEPVSYPVLTGNVTRADLEALPVADDSMTSDELRALCLAYMEMEKSVLWRVNRSVAYLYDGATFADSQGNLHLKKDVLYRGLPYTGANYDLAALFDVMEEETGLVDLSSVPRGDAVAQMIGNTCFTACYWAWARIATTFVYKGLSRMTPMNHTIPLGPYVSASGERYEGEEDTTHICLKNGEQVMYESYACLLPADGLLTKSDSNGGHGRMAKEAAVVVRNADGTINGDESYVICMEQTSVQVSVETENGSAKQFSGPDNKYTFAELFRTRYLPFTLPELVGEAPIQKAWVKVVEEVDSFSDLVKANVTSNYVVSRLDAQLKNAAGEIVFERNCKCPLTTKSNTYLIPVSRVLYQSAPARSVSSGEKFTAVLFARLGNGETLTVFEGEFTF